MVSRTAQIIPTLFATNEKDYRTRAGQVNSCAEFATSWVQIDFMDNKFVQNQSIDLDVVEKYPIHGKKEAHLMVQDPINWIDELPNLGFERAIFPIEVGNTKEIIEKIKSVGMQAGIFLNPSTSLDNLLPFLDTIDLVLVMGVNPGFQGQKFIPETLDRVKRLVELRGDRHYIIQVDGGVNLDTAKDLKDAGVDILAVGSFLFNGNITQNLEKIKQQVQA